MKRGNLFFSSSRAWCALFPLPKGKGNGRGKRAGKGKNTFRSKKNEKSIRVSNIYPHKRESKRIETAVKDCEKREKRKRREKK